MQKFILYTPPCFEVVDLQVEKGFASSFYGDPGKSGSDPDWFFYEGGDL